MSEFRLWSLWDMLRTYYPIYELALRIAEMRYRSELMTGEVSDYIKKSFRALLQDIQTVCHNFGLAHTFDMAKRAAAKPTPEKNEGIFAVLDHLNDSLSSELEKEHVFRIPHDRKDYFETADLFGKKVSTAFPSCTRDIQKAGSCYALQQEDACVHHCMLVLEGGLRALATELGLPYHRDSWQKIIGGINTRLGSLPRGPKRDSYLEMNAQFGFLKDAYRNHSEHAHDDPYDMEKALSILIHVRGFMQAMEKAGVHE